MYLALVNQFDSLAEYPKSCLFHRGKDRKVRFLILVGQGKIIHIYEMKSKTPVQTLQFEERVNSFSVQDSTLMVSTAGSSRVYNWQTLQVLFYTIPGVLYQLDSQQLLLLTATTLYQIDMLKVDGISEIKHFELGVQDYLFSEPRDNEGFLVVSSSVSYIYSTQSRQLTQFNFVLAKLLFCNSEYLCGLSINGGLCVRSLLADFTVFETHNPCKNVVVFDEQICFVQNSLLKIYNLNSSYAPTAELPLDQPAADLIVTEESIYVLTTGLKLLGVKREDLGRKTLLKKVASKSEPTAFNFEPTDKAASILMEDLSKTLVNIDSEYYLIKGLVSNIRYEHSRFQATMNHRTNCLKVVYKWWSTGNLRACINAIDHHEDNAILSDCVVLMSHGLSSLTKEHLPSILKACTKLINSKYPSHVETGLETANSALQALPKIAKADPETEGSLSTVIESLRKSPRLYKILSTTKMSHERRQIYEAAYLLQRYLDKYLKFNCG